MDHNSLLLLSNLLETALEFLIYKHQRNPQWELSDELIQVQVLSIQKKLMKLYKETTVSLIFRQELVEELLAINSYHTRVLSQKRKN